ncbi:hypothetical protein, partial [Escherichia coli]|uniref:hypothetical protein n=1 Tax=Escherichia coli TaxID=562 RepID=UPI0032178802
RHRSVRLVILVGLAIDQIAQSGLSSLSVIYYSAQLFSTISAIAGKKAFIIIKLPSGLQVSLIIYIGIVADILRISLSLYKL